jgi:DNA-binding MarR family transcriptional regulator
MRIIRDARSTRGGHRQLLNALALRCSPDKNYITWPSYRQLSLDTLLDPATLKRAAHSLEESKLIKRGTRQNRSNLFWINTALLQKQAAAIKAAEVKAKVDDLAAIPQPFETSEPEESEQECNCGYGNGTDAEPDEDWDGGSR